MWWRSIIRRSRADAGFTLPELLIATVLGLIVVGSAVAMFSTGIRAEPRAAERADAIQQARTMAERITRELRMGSNATSATPSELAILTYVPSGNCITSAPGSATRCRVFYSCSASGTCSRRQCGPNTIIPPLGCGPSEIAIEGLSSNQVFTFSPKSPGQAMVTVRLEFPATDGEDAITIVDGAALRNPPLGGP
jgi:prepilin-type N-terminal cleavage/methylation domain-containing protein